MKIETDAWICEIRTHVYGVQDIYCKAKPGFEETPDVVMGVVGKRNIPEVVLYTGKYISRFTNRNIPSDELSIEKSTFEFDTKNYQKTRTINNVAWLSMGETRIEIMNLFNKVNSSITATDIQNTLGVSTPHFSQIRDELLEKKFIKCLNPTVHYGKRYEITITGRNALIYYQNMIKEMDLPKKRLDEKE